MYVLCRNWKPEHTLMILSLSSCQIFKKRENHTTSLLAVWFFSCAILSLWVTCCYPQLLYYKCTGVGDTPVAASGIWIQCTACGIPGRIKTFMKKRGHT